MYRMIDAVNSLGETLVGWDELLGLDVKQDNIITVWRRYNKPDYLRKPLTKGYLTIMCPRKPLYSSFVQYKDHKRERIWDEFCPMEDVYASSDKQFAEWGASVFDLSHVKGIQADIWTELMHIKDRVDLMTFPCPRALAESAWPAPTVKDYDKLLSRMKDTFTLSDKLNVYYSDYRNLQHHPEPTGLVVKKKEEVQMDFRD